MKARYLTFFSYIGTKFRSSEKLWLKEGRNYPDPESVQGLMELALLKIRPVNYPNLTLSSRTDGGVHALNSSAHVDLERKGENIYETHYVTYEMNKFFFKNDISILVRKCLRVNDNFSARFNALSRTYLYRLAVLKPDLVIEENTALSSFVPIEEWKRCHFLRHQEFDIERFKEGAKHLEGYHDFTTFKKFDKLLQYKHNRREIKSIVVAPGRPSTTAYSTGIENCFNYWDIEIKGKAFVHNQIRRMIGTLISVAIVKLEPDDVKVMLQIPSKHSWHTFIQNCPPDGLYLCNVEYNPEDLVYDPEKNLTNVSEGIESEV
ncbi:tRNA pseudouridine synthase-like 1 isoform X1 [Maniola jurtina]|uniref:tRNA pseudouridine synthase-like 1 isoform X1 n=2 Tax=Maniola jurtina TaxID=191418 RepID=UPI001E687DCF|nr:tRNA pseudouridine synthase-like 1 isoform X1 [Maniola jurtina]